MLTAAKVRAAEPRDRAYQIADGLGMYLYVAPTGTRSFRMSFRFAGRAQTLVFGRADNITLSQARDMRDEARQLLRRGENPASARRRAIAPDRVSCPTFEEAARDWHQRQRPRWSAEHAGDVLDSLQRHVFAPIGAMPIDDISPSTVLEVLRAVEATGAIGEARRIRQRISGIFQTAIAEGKATINPAAAVTAALTPAPEPIGKAAVLDVDQAQKVLLDLDGAKSTPIERLASQLLVLTAVRWAAVRGARWTEIAGVDWTGERPDSKPVWIIPAERMKLSVARKGMPRYSHPVPLSCQAVAVLRAARRIAGNSPLVFPRGPKNSTLPIGINALSEYYARAGLRGRHCPHGWRATFSTIMNERRPLDRLSIDACLAHLPKDKVEAAYNRSTQLDLRRELLDEWADVLMPLQGVQHVDAR